VIFSLEALRALHGDCLLLHFGSRDNPRTVLIDGGPPPVYGQTLKPRLLELRKHLISLGRIGSDDPLPLTLVMVSHADADHIGGLLALTDDLGGGLGLPHKCLVEPKTLWHNTFEQLAADSATVGNLELDRESKGTTAAVIASVAQGNRLRSNAEVLGWSINRPFDGPLVEAPERGGQSVALDDATSILVVAPRSDEIAGLRAEWSKQMSRLKLGETRPAEIAEYLDKSPYNLSSIVCLARQGDRRILLTGDARGDLILKALDAAGVTTNGAMHVDVIKIPHHGSIRDVDTDFFERISADHYVISASGRYGNPETKTLEMIVQSRSSDDFAIHLTYAACEGDLDQRLAAFAAARALRRRTFAIETRQDPALSLSVDLGEPPFT
jgi:hypothetical protein